MPPNRFESEVESFLEGSHGDRTHIKRADHHTVTPLCGTLLWACERGPVWGLLRGPGRGLVASNTLVNVNRWSYAWLRTSFVP